MKMSSSSSTADSISSTKSSSLLDTLTDEERIIYNELSSLSTKIRMLDEIYYGGGAASTLSTTTTLDSEEVSDDEYDALARREVELCTSYPKLLSILENESGLGSLVTRFGGRVGQLYTSSDGADNDDNKGDKKQKKSKKKKAATKRKKRIKRLHLHNSPMQSLDNAMNDIEAVNWINRIQKLLLQSSDKSDDYAQSIQIMAEPKIDGLSLSLRYQLRESSSTGRIVYDFIWGATRGDGKQGEDVTEAVQSAWMNKSNFTIPQSFTFPGDDNMPPQDIIEVRGEVVLPQQAFDEFTTNVTNINSTANNSSSTSSSTKVKTFSNARNAASGILLRSKEPTSTEEIESTRFLQSHLQFYAYDIVSSNDGTSSSWMSSVIGGSGNEMRDSLTKLGFHVPTPVIMETLDISHDKEFNETDIPNLLAYHKKMMSTRDEPSASSSKKDADFPYQIDGVVYKLTSFNDRQVCGSSSRTPRWAIAHKFPPQVAITRLIDVDVQVGRTGALTPVAILEPIDLGGVLVSRASLHNFYFARSLLIPKKNTSKGDEDFADEGSSSMSVKKGVSVLVSRAGDVIPQVKKRVYESDDEDIISHNKYANETISLEAPRTCPACGSPTSYEFVSLPPKKSKKKTRKKAEVESDIEVESVEFTADAVEESGQVLRCSGPQLLCQPRAVNALAYAYSRAGLDVKGLSKAKLNHLMDEGIIRFPSDLFTTFGSKDGENTTSEEQKDMLRDIANLPGWGEQSAQNVAESVRLVASEGVDLSRYIYALGIPTIGTHVSQLIASAYGDVDSFLKALDEASLHTDNGSEDDDEENNNESKLIPFATLTGDDTSEKVKGIGPTAISAMVSFSKEEVLVKAAKDLANVLTIHSVVDNTTSTTNQGGITGKQLQFKDMTVVFTGSIPGMSRTVAQKIVKELGAKSTPNTVSKSTTLVVEGEKGGKKARQAKELGVRVIDYKEFIKMIET